MSSRSPGAAAPVPLAEERLSAGRLLPLLCRSFFLQGSWSFERMQSVGWTAALAGEGRRLAGSDRARLFLERHLAYFNTNPVMASYLIGGVVRLEEEVASGRLREEDVARFKRGLTGPLAAWGDTFFWASLRPAATVLGSVAALVAGGWGVLVYLLAYNTFHLFYRIKGLAEGYRWGPAIAERLRNSTVRTRAGLVREAGLAGAGALLAMSLLETGRAGTPSAWVVPAFAGGLFLLLRKRIGGGTGWGLVAVFAGLVYAWATAGR